MLGVGIRISRRARVLAGKKGKKETLSPRQKPSSLAATKSGSVPEGREETALPQVRWVGTAARVPGWISCKGQGGRDP